jgi:hypothetical protein
MDEGFRMIAKLNGVTPDDVCIGAPMQITCQEVTLVDLDGIRARSGLGRRGKVS